MARMRFYTKEESEKWLMDRGRSKPDAAPGLTTERVNYPPDPYRFFHFALSIASRITCREPSLLLITEWGIWASSENWHLYYKLRQSYGDTRLLQEAPGHLFLGHETDDLASFLQLAMLNGWGGYVLTQADYLNVFFSHDEYIDFFAESPANLIGIRETLGTTAPGGGPL